VKQIYRNMAMGLVGATAFATTSASAGRPTWNYAGIAEVTIDRPARDVWPYFFGDKEVVWMGIHWIHVTGESGQVGEVYKNSFMFHGNRISAFYEAIKVTSERHLVLKMTYTENDSSKRNLMGYELFTLNEVAGHTTVVLQQAFAIPVSEPKEDLNRETRQQDTELADLAQKLKKLLESGQ
jgi:hypothetical protein